MFFSIQQENQLTFLFRRAQQGICEGWSPMKVAFKKTVQKQTAVPCMLHGGQQSVPAFPLIIACL